MASKDIKFYWSSATSTQKIKKDAHALKTLLDAKKAKYTAVDVASDEDGKKEMWANSDNNRSLPQVCVFVCCCSALVVF